MDVMDSIVITYQGENGMATATVTNNKKDINQRMQELLDSLRYEVVDNVNLSNGDVILIQASYDEEIANQYNFEPINLEKEVVVSGLHDRYASLDKIDPAYLEKIETSALEYVEKNADEIEKGASNAQLVYEAFLKSKQASVSDRMAFVYSLSYIENDMPSVLYYVVLVPEINDGNEVASADIYGEKAYMSQEERDAQNFAGYIERVFSGQFTIEQKNKEEP